jgi:hypothetical protein
MYDSKLTRPAAASAQMLTGDTKFNLNLVSPDADDQCGCTCSEGLRRIRNKWLPASVASTALLILHHSLHTRLKSGWILQTVLLDTVDAEAIGADMSAAEEGTAGGKPLSEKDSVKRRHVTLRHLGRREDMPLCS